MKYKNLRIKATRILEHHEGPVGKIVGYFLIGIILLSVGAFALETTDYVVGYEPLIKYFDAFVLGVFALEYVARFLLAPNKFKFVRSPLAVVDLLVIIGYAFSFGSLSFLRGLRVFKIFQILKIVRYSDIMGAFFQTFKNYKNELRIFWITFFMVLLFSASGLYFLEKDANPEYFGTLPDSFWWAMVTMTTVGYGDAVPITLLGKMLASVVMVLGLATIAILTAVITKIFMDHFFGRRYHTCSRCHYPWHDFDASFCKNCGEKLDVMVK